MANDLGYGAPPTELQPRALDPGALQVIRQSAGRLAQMEYTFIRQLHYDVTRLIPDAAGTPAADMWAFCERMVQSLLWVALTDQPPQVIIDTLRQVGARNRFEGFPDAQYVSVAHALVRTVRDLSGNDWSASTGSAWISYFMWIKPHLLAGARQAAAEQAAAQHGRRPAGRRPARRRRAGGRPGRGAFPGLARRSHAGGRRRQPRVSGQPAGRRG